VLFRFFCGGVAFILSTESHARRMAESVTDVAFERYMSLPLVRKMLAGVSVLHAALEVLTTRRCVADTG
jgi:hypothetical protein